MQTLFTVASVVTGTCSLTLNFSTKSLAVKQALPNKLGLIDPDELHLKLPDIDS